MLYLVQETTPDYTPTKYVTTEEGALGLRFAALANMVILGFPRGTTERPSVLDIEHCANQVLTGNLHSMWTQLLHQASSDAATNPTSVLPSCPSWLCPLPTPLPPSPALLAISHRPPHPHPAKTKPSVTQQWS